MLKDRCYITFSGMPIHKYFLVVLNNCGRTLFAMLAINFIGKENSIKL